LEPAFDRLLSVDGCRRFKPHLAHHHWAAEQIGRETAERMLAATHDWDVARAAWAGLQTGFIAREGQSLFGPVRAPILNADDFGALADTLNV